MTLLFIPVFTYFTIISPLICNSRFVTSYLSSLNTGRDATVGRTNVTDDRQTDGRAIAFSERERRENVQI